MKAVIFGGTTEGRELSLQLAEDGAEVTVCVATEYGREEQGEHPRIRTLVGPLSPAEKQILLRDAAVCVDATHPYARRISVSVREACQEAGVPCLRLLRGEAVPDAVLPKTEGIRFADNAAEAAAYLTEVEGNILLTTGTRDLAAYDALPRERLFPRVLPSHEALSSCESQGIPHRNIIAMQGPFSEELNRALMRQYEIRYLVTKDTGKAGGFPEKLSAARACEVGVIVLRRPEEQGQSFEEVLTACRSILHIPSENTQPRRFPS